jgi:hypothetical protein
MGKDSGTRHEVHYAVKYGKKVLLIKPRFSELHHYEKQYDGIIVTAKKYRKNSHVVLIKNPDALEQILAALEIERQLDLYND